MQSLRIKRFSWRSNCLFRRNERFPINWLDSFQEVGHLWSSPYCWEESPDVQQCRDLQQCRWKKKKKKKRSERDEFLHVSTSTRIVHPSLYFKMIRKRKKCNSMLFKENYRFLAVKHSMPWSAKLFNGMKTANYSAQLFSNTVPWI